MNAQERAATIDRLIHDAEHAEAGAEFAQKMVARYPAMPQHKEAAADLTAKALQLRAQAAALMDATWYASEAGRTLIDDATAAVGPLTPREHRQVWNVCGLAGEALEILALLPRHPAAIQLAIQAGGLLEHFKKGVFHGAGVDVASVRERLIAMLGHMPALVGAADLPAAIRLLGELGDWHWYAHATAVCCDLDYPALVDAALGPEAGCLGPVWAANSKKLRARFPGGWDPGDAAARRDEAGAAIPAAWRSSLR